MSEYSNFVTDFPARCGKLLEELRLPSTALGLEVTLLLALASVGFSIPYERLRENPEWRHPSNDRQRFREAAEAFDRLCETPFLGSRLWPSRGAGTWKKGRVRDVFAGPEGWAGLQDAKEIAPDVLSRTVLGILRNGLAHGNVLTRGNPIKEVILLSRHEGPAFRFLSVSPADLRLRVTASGFLAFLAELEIDALPISSDDDVA